MIACNQPERICRVEMNLLCFCHAVQRHSSRVQAQNFQFRLYTSYRVNNLRFAVRAQAIRTCPKAHERPNRVYNKPTESGQNNALSIHVIPLSCGSMTRSDSAQNNSTLLLRSTNGRRHPPPPLSPRLHWVPPWRKWQKSSLIQPRRHAQYPGL